MSEVCEDGVLVMGELMQRAEGRGMEFLHSRRWLLQYLPNHVNIVQRISYIDTASDLDTLLLLQLQSLTAMEFANSNPRAARQKR